MTLKTYAQVTKINRKSTSECFRGLEVGDLIEFSCEIKKSGRNHRGGYYRTGAHRTGAQWISCVNQRTLGKSNLSFNQIGRVLECCELVELTAYQFDMLMQIHETRP